MSDTNEYPRMSHLRGFIFNELRKRGRQTVGDITRIYDPSAPKNLHEEMTRGNYPLYRAMKDAFNALEKEGKIEKKPPGKGRYVVVESVIPKIDNEDVTPMEDIQYLAKQRSRIFDGLQDARMKRRRIQKELNNVAEAMARANASLTEAIEKEGALEYAYQRAHTNVTCHPAYEEYKEEANKRYLETMRSRIQ